MAKKIKVTLRRSAIGRKPQHRATLRAMGLHKLGRSAVLPDNEAVRGMVRSVQFLVDTEEVDA